MDFVVSDLLNNGMFLNLKVRARVEEAKRIMEEQMMAELERQREAELRLQKQKEVEIYLSITRC